MIYFQVSHAITQRSDSGREDFKLTSGVLLDESAFLRPSKILHRIEPALLFLILWLALTTHFKFLKLLSSLLILL